MTLIQAIILGLIQGLTEFLPVSSTAHMRIGSELLYGQDAGAAFSAVAQMGPIVAIVAYFWNDLSRYLKGVIRTKSPGKVPANDVDARLGWFTILGTLPLAAAGVALEKWVDTTYRSLYVTAFSLIALALVLVVAERTGRKKKSIDKMTFGDSQAIGWAQILALVPGASRSGVTITAGLFAGLNRESAARFSFLLSIPAITAAGLYKLAKVMAHPATLKADLVPYVAAAIVAGAVAYVVIKWFLGFMKEHSTAGFIVYRILLGVILLILLQMQVLKPGGEPNPADAASAPAAQTR